MGGKVNGSLTSGDYRGDSRGKLALRPMIDRSAFPRIEGLVDLACRNGVDVRPTLLRVLTDLYVQTPSHSAAEEAQFVALALRLIESVDAPTRAAIATRLAAYRRAPAAVMDRLQEMVGAIAAPKPAAPAPVPAPAREADPANAFFAADSYERQLMLTNLDTAAARPPRRNPAAMADACRRLEAAVLEHRPAEFVQLLERTLQLPHAVAQKIAEDPFGEPIVVAAKALGMPSAALQRILLLINPAIGHSVARVYELSALYDEITVQTAESLLDIWRGGAVRRPGYQPALYDDEARSARAAAATNRYQTNRRSDALAARFRNSGR
jgi:hypothetical protein